MILPTTKRLAINTRFNLYTILRQQTPTVHKWWCQLSPHKKRMVVGGKYPPASDPICEQELGQLILVTIPLLTRVYKVEEMLAQV